MLCRCCVAKPKPFDGMTIVALKMDANGKIMSAKIHQTSGDPEADADAVHRAKAEINGVRRKFRSGTILAFVTGLQATTDDLRRANK